MTENEEILDIYDGERRPMGYTKRRDEPLEPGEFIVAVGIWIVDDKGRLLITKRSMKKRYAPGKWENTGGHLMHGEEPVAAVMRENLSKKPALRSRARTCISWARPRCRPFSATTSSRM